MRPAPGMAIQAERSVEQAAIAQLVEHRIRNAGVRCSSHLSGTIPHLCRMNQVSGSGLDDEKSGNDQAGPHRILDSQRLFQEDGGHEWDQHKGQRHEGIGVG